MPEWIWKKVREVANGKTMGDKYGAILARDPIAQTLLPAVTIGLVIACICAGLFGAETLGRMSGNSWFRDHEAVATAWNRMFFWGGAAITVMGGVIAGRATCIILDRPPKPGDPSILDPPEHAAERLGCELRNSYLGQEATRKLQKHSVTVGITRGLGLAAIVACGMSGGFMAIAIMTTLISGRANWMNDDTEIKPLYMAAGAAAAWLLSMMLCSRELKKVPAVDAEDA